jgi:hypothetical protein
LRPARVAKALRVCRCYRHGAAKAPSCRVHPPTMAAVAVVAGAAVS